MSEKGEAETKRIVDEVSRNMISEDLTEEDADDREMLRSKGLLGRRILIALQKIKIFETKIPNCVCGGGIC